MNDNNLEDIDGFNNLELENNEVEKVIDEKPSLLAMKRDISAKNRFLNKEEHIQMVQIIKEDSAKMTKNQNGFFINLNFLSGVTIEKLYNFVNFAVNNKKEIEEQHNQILKEREKLNINEYELENSNDDNLHTFENTIKTDLLEKNSMVDELFNMDVQSFKVMKDFSEDEINEANAKLNLKKGKAKFSGYQAKLIKKYKNVNKLNKVNGIIMGEEQKQENAALFDLEMSKASLDASEIK